jgi:hypothetical protein
MSRPVDYHEYILSAEWRERAEAAKRAAGYRCQLCNSADGPLHAHHRTYDRLGHEEPSDITVLCSRCHGLYHDKIATPGIYQAIVQALPDVLQKRGVPRTNPYDAPRYDWTAYSDAKRIIDEFELLMGVHLSQCGSRPTEFYDACMHQVYRYLRMTE